MNNQYRFVIVSRHFLSRAVPCSYNAVIYAHGSFLNHILYLTCHPLFQPFSYILMYFVYSNSNYLHLHYFVTMRIWTVLSHPFKLSSSQKTTTTTGARRRPFTKAWWTAQASSILLPFCFQFEISNCYIFISDLKD